MNSSEVIQKLIDREINLIDVRAPIEFAAGHVPYSINLPILNDAERALIGTTYKNKGSEAAVQLGYRLISGDIKHSRIHNWINHIQSSEKRVVVMCFRGGLRSQITQQWLKDSGFNLDRVIGGYKELRTHFIQNIEDQCLKRLKQPEPFLVLTGKTGCGKSLLLRQLNKEQVIDLESLAHHRGSAFGSLGDQPSQASFENELSFELLQKQNQVPIVEDESRMIGKIILPEFFFKTLRSSPVVYLEKPLSTRIDNTLAEYVLRQLHEPGLFLQLKKSLFQIQRRLGGLRYSEILNDLIQAEFAWQEHQDSSPNRLWIEKLLVWYYDPIYSDSFKRRSPKVLFKGNTLQVKQFINSDW